MLVCCGACVLWCVSTDEVMALLSHAQSNQAATLTRERSSGLQAGATGNGERVTDSTLQCRQ